jgi:hypothetical protein
MSVKLSEPMTMINSLSIAPSPERDRCNGPETRPGIEPSGRGNVIPNLPTLVGTLALQGKEGVRKLLASFTAESLVFFLSRGGD